jgi:phosphatidylglycerol:prolipoprotein diacylglycerol transferase
MFVPAPAVVHWGVSPEIVRLGPLVLRWYSLCFIISFTLGYLIIRWILRREKKPEVYLDSLVLYVFFGTIIGARLGHCLFYDPSYYFHNPMEVLKVWHGGLASHGASVGIITALYLFVRKRPDLTFLWVIDRVVIVVALSGVFIRLGNLFNSEVIGRATSVPWAFVFTRIDDLPRHPTQVYASLFYVVLFFALLTAYRKCPAALAPGWLFGAFLVTVFTFRFFVEYTKETPIVLHAGIPLTMGQVLSLPLVLLGIIVWWRARSTRPRPAAKG